MIRITVEQTLDSSHDYHKRGVQFEDDTAVEDIAALVEQTIQRMREEING